MNQNPSEKDILQQKNLNFIDKPIELNDFLDTLKSTTPQYAKALQESLLTSYATLYLGEKENRKRYYQQAIKKEKVVEGNYTFDARIIFITNKELTTLFEEKYNSRNDGKESGWNTNIISGITAGGLSSGFGLIHLKNTTNIGLFNIPNEALEALNTETKNTIINLFQKRAGEGNHDRFHNKSMDTIEKVFMKERYHTIRDKLLILHESYPKFFTFMIKHPKLWNMYNKILNNTRELDMLFIQISEENKKQEKQRNTDDLYVKARKFYHNHIRDPKRKKINVPDIMGGGRTKHYSAMLGIPAETHIYEYFSILIHFRFLTIVYENHPEVEQQMIADTQKYLLLIQGLDIDQELKDFWIGVYLRFTSRSIDLKKIDIEKYIDYIPEISDSHGKLDIYTFNETLKTDIERMDQGYTVT